MASVRRILNKLESDAALRREGVIDATQEAIGQQSRRSIESHLADYEARLRAANRTGNHVSRTMTFIREIAKAAGFTAAGDVTADAVNRLQRRAAKGPRQRLERIVPNHCDLSS